MDSTAHGLVKVRVIAAHEDVAAMAEMIGELLESRGFEVIEFSKAYTLQPPEDFRSRIFVSAIRKE
ncbi:hypothetical protein SY88_23835 [Clostridiales bacterium PH28_bin88]|nr:hypothetical protein SY88_23835 [Clostridiales bacterium PH28_bin88]